MDRDMRYVYAFMLALTLVACSDPATQKCEELAKKVISTARSTDPKYDRMFPLFKTQSFYSRPLDACVLTEVSEVGVRFVIRDISNTFLKDLPAYQSNLLYCDEEGADSVIESEVKKRRGLVFYAKYNEWLDNGFGGPPRTLKTPAKPYTRQDCERVFQKWMGELR